MSEPLPYDAEVASFLSTIPRPLRTKVRHALVMCETRSMDTLRRYAAGDEFCQLLNFGTKSLMELRAYLAAASPDRCTCGARTHLQVKRMRAELNAAMGALKSATGRLKEVERLINAAALHE